MVSTAVLGEVVGTDALGAIAGADHGFACGGDGGVLFGLFDFVECSAEECPGAFFVLGLGFMFGHFELEACGLVEESPACFDLVDVLSAGSAAAATELFDVFRVDIDFDVLQFGEYGDGSGGGVDATLCLSFWDTLDAVSAAFEAKVTVSGGSGDLDDDFFEAAAF